MTAELEKAEQEFKKLSQYIKDYQSKTSEKVRGCGCMRDDSARADILGYAGRHLES